MELTKDEITEFALLEMMEHDLVGVSFWWDTYTDKFGKCHAEWDGYKWIVTGISMSEPFFSGLIDKYEALDTVYHEIAHAIDARDNNNLNHGESWKEIAQSLGARPSPSVSKALDYTKTGHKYIANCSSDCGYSWGFHRMGTVWKRDGYRCPDCKEPLVVERIY